MATWMKEEKLLPLLLVPAGWKSSTLPGNREWRTQRREAVSPTALTHQHNQTPAHPTCKLLQEGKVVLSWDSGSGRHTGEKPCEPPLCPRHSLLDLQDHGLAGMVMGLPPNHVSPDVPLRTTSCSSGSDVHRFSTYSIIKCTKITMLSCTT